MSKKTLLMAICEKTQVSLAQAEAALDAVTQHIGERPGVLSKLTAKPQNIAFLIDSNSQHIVVYR